MRWAPDPAAGAPRTQPRAAHVSAAHLTQDPHIPPLTQTLHELREDLAREDVVTIGARRGPRRSGSVRGEFQASTATLCRLAVAPDIQGRGIGTQMLFEVLPYLPEQTTEIWVFTGKDSKQNLAMYTKHGYEEQYDKAAGDLTYTYLRRILGEAEARNESGAVGQE